MAKNTIRCTLKRGVIQTHTVIQGGEMVGFGFEVAAFKHYSLFI